MATLIHNVTELQAINDDLQGQYELANDIDAEDTKNWNGGLGFKPIGQDEDHEDEVLPVSDLSSSGSWTVYPSGSKYDKVDDGAAHDGDSTYIETADASAKVMFTITPPSIPDDAVDIGVELHWVEKFIGDDYSSFYPIIRMNGVEYESEDAEYSYRTNYGSSSVWFDCPFNDGLWLPENIAQLDGFGIRIFEKEGDGTARFTSLYLVVSYSRYFAGDFDGKKHIITKLFINRPTEDEVGLFGRAYWNGNDADPRGSIKDVALIDADITGRDNTGALAGSITVFKGDEVLEGCSSTGVVTGESGVGGLVGASQVQIERCWSSCDVTGVGTGNSSIGGLIGQFYFTAPHNRCFALGDVSAPNSSWVGGFVGGMACLYVPGTEIGDMFARGAVTGNAKVGGFAGGTCGGSTCYMKRVYSTGAVTGSTSVGGLIGYRYSYPPTHPVEDSYWDTQTSGQAASDGGTGKTTAQMKTQSTFTDWDFDTIWVIVSAINDGYPLLLGVSSLEGIVLYAADITKTAATLWGKIINDADDTCEWRFRYRKGTGAYTETAWTNTKIAGETFSKAISSLTQASLYEFACQIRTASLVSDWSEAIYFTTLSPREEIEVEDKITLEAIRNIEMAAKGRFYIDEEGNATYRSRLTRA